MCVCVWNEINLCRSYLLQLLIREPITVISDSDLSGTSGNTRTRTRTTTQEEEEEKHELRLALTRNQLYCVYVCVFWLTGVWVGVV